MDDRTTLLHQRLRKGDRDALCELIELSQHRLRQIIQLRLDPRLAGRISCSDVVQEINLDALKRIEQIQNKPELPFHLWLRMLANQRLVDIHREHLGTQKRDAAAEISLQGLAFTQVSSVALATIFAAKINSPSQDLVRKEVLEKVANAFEEMEPIDREVLSMRHIEDLTNEEVSTILGITTTAASKRYIRALRRLKTLLAGISA